MKKFFICRMSKISVDVMYSVSAWSIVIGCWGGVVFSGPSAGGHRHIEHRSHWCYWGSVAVSNQAIVTFRGIHWTSYCCEGWNLFIRTETECHQRFCCIPGRVVRSGSSAERSVNNRRCEYYKLMHDLIDGRGLEVHGVVRYFCFVRLLRLVASESDSHLIDSFRNHPSLPFLALWSQNFNWPNIQNHQLMSEIMVWKKIMCFDYHTLSKSEGDIRTLSDNYNTGLNEETHILW